MDLEIITVSEVSQTEKEKYHMGSLMCGIYNTTWTYLQNRDRLTDIDDRLTDIDRLVVAKEKGKEGLGVWD